MAQDLGEYTVEVQGLAEMRKALRRQGREYRKAFDRELKAIGTPIAKAAKDRYRELHPRRRGGRGSQRGIRSSSRRGESSVVLGSVRYPYLLGQEWGANQSKYPQFPKHTREGHFFWPAVVDGSDQVVDRLTELIDKANRLAFPQGGNR